MVLSVRLVHDTNISMNNRAFTLIETMIVMGIMATLIGLGVVRATSIERRAPLSATVTTIVADLRGQQTKAMAGYTQGDTVANAYSVYFETNQYTLFKGMSFNASEPTNAAFPLPTNVTFSTIDLPSSSIVFDKGSGDVVGHSDSANTMVITQGLTGESQTITINRYGTVVSVE